MPGAVSMHNSSRSVATNKRQLANAISRALSTVHIFTGFNGTRLCHSLLQRAAVVVSTPLPSSWGYCKAHTPAMCDDPMAVAFAGANALYYLNGKSASSILYIVSCFR